MSVLESKKRKKDLEKDDIVLIVDPESSSKLFVVEQEARESNDESNLLELVGSMDGIKKMGKMWLTLIQSARVENVLMNHLIQNSINIEDISNFLLESLSEVLKEKLFEQSIEVGFFQEKEIDLQNLLEELDDAKKTLSICIKELRDCIHNASRVYRYYIS